MTRAQDKPKVQAPKTRRSSGSHGPPRLSRNWIIALAGLAAVAIAAVLIGVSVSGSDGGSGSGSPVAISGAQETRALLREIPQRGIELGDPKAPVTLVEYADIQCPFCAEWARLTFPTLVEKYVRPGDVKVVFRGQAFLGPDSDRALRAALAAGDQNRLWHVVELLYHNQGQENSGWATDDLVRSIGAAVPGLDAERMMDERFTPAVVDQLVEARDAFAESGFTGTPSFQAGKTGGELEPLRITSLEPGEFEARLDELLGR